MTATTVSTVDRVQGIVDNFLDRSEDLTAAQIKNLSDAVLKLQQAQIYNKLHMERMDALRAVEKVVSTVKDYLLTPAQIDALVVAALAKAPMPDNAADAVGGLDWVETWKLTFSDALGQAIADEIEKSVQPVVDGVCVKVAQGEGVS